MSRVFYDHLIIFESLEDLIKRSTQSTEEREELWGVIDEMIHHRVMGCILDVLDIDHHHDFLSMFSSCPYEEKIIGYINQRIDDEIEELISCEICKLEKELIKMLSS